MWGLRMKPLWCWNGWPAAVGLDRETVSHRHAHLAAVHGGKQCCLVDQAARAVFTTITPAFALRQRGGVSRPRLSSVSGQCSEMASRLAPRWFQVGACTKAAGSWRTGRSRSRAWASAIFKRRGRWRPGPRPMVQPPSSRLLCVALSQWPGVHAFIELPPPIWRRPAASASACSATAAALAPRQPPPQCRAPGPLPCRWCRCRCRAWR